VEERWTRGRLQGTPWIDKETTHAHAWKKWNKIAKLVRELYFHLRCNRPIFCLSSLLPFIRLSFWKDTPSDCTTNPSLIGPHSTRSLPLHVYVAYALPEFSLARRSIVTEGPRNVAYLRRQHRCTRSRDCKLCSGKNLPRVNYYRGEGCCSGGRSTMTASHCLWWALANIWQREYYEPSVILVRDALARAQIAR